MSLDDLVRIDISVQDQSPSEQGFGTPLVLAFHTHNTDRVRAYTDLAGMVADGFQTNEPAYLKAQAIFSQSPSVASLKVARRTTGSVQSVEITPEAPAGAGKVYALSANGHAVSYTSILADDLAAVCTALATAIHVAAPEVAATGSSGTKVVCTISAASEAWDISHTYSAGAVASTSAGKWVSLAGTNVGHAPATSPTWWTFVPYVVSYVLTRKADLSCTLSLHDATPDAGIATELNALELVDSDWYGLLIDSDAPAEILAGSAWIEANKRVFCAQTADSACFDGGSTTDVLYLLKAAGYARTLCEYVPGIGFTQLAAGHLGFGLTVDLDSGESASWFGKTLRGVTSYVLTPTQRAAVLAKNGGLYMVTAGIAITEQGKSASGEWMDVTQGVDWLRARMQTRCFRAIIARPKLPYTDGGIAVIQSEADAQLQAGVRAQFLVGDPKPLVWVPKAADVSSADKTARVLRGVRFTATLAGAIHSLVIQGTITP